MGMLAGMNLSKAGMDLSKAGMNPSKPREKHHHHVIIRAQSAHQQLTMGCLSGPRRCCVI